MNRCTLKAGLLTTSNSVNLVLYEEVYQGYQGTKKAACKDLPVFHGSWVVWTKCQAAQRPWQCSDQVGDHENVMPAMVIRRSDIGPSAACQCPENPYSGYEFGQN